MASASRPAIFRSTPGSVKTLRAFYKDKNVVLDANALIQEFNAESDRTTIILMGALVDDALKQVISLKIPCEPDETEKKHIFRFEGPLGSFSSRIEIATLFGIIDEKTYLQLETIRELRNACAHSKRLLRFSD